MTGGNLMGNQSDVIIKVNTMIILHRHDINDESEVKAETGRYTEFEERYLLPALQVDLLLHI